MASEWGDEISPPPGLDKKPNLKANKPLFAINFPICHSGLVADPSDFSTALALSSCTGQILYGAVSEEEKRNITPVVYANTITSMKILVEQATALEEEVSAGKRSREPPKSLPSRPAALAYAFRIFYTFKFSNLFFIRFQFLIFIFHISFSQFIFHISFPNFQIFYCHFSIFLTSFFNFSNFIVTV